MDTKKDPIGAVDEISSDIDYMRTLLNAATDKTVFYLENRKLLGPYGELLYSCAAELDNLLCLARRYLEKMDGEVGTVTDCLYRLDLPCAAE